jgi:hypothetical protein
MRAGFETAALNVENKVHDLLRPQESEPISAGKSDSPISAAILESASTGWVHTHE